MPSGGQEPQQRPQASTGLESGSSVFIREFIGVNTPGKHPPGVVFLCHGGGSGRSALARTAAAS